MKSALAHTLMAISAWLVAAASAIAAPLTSFDDIVFWTGAGANRAAIVIDFDGALTTDQALTWGYRWDGIATGRDMILAVVAADPRLYLKVNTLAVEEIEFYGIGYDRNNDGAFAVSTGAAFDDAGIAQGVYDDAALPIDAADWYREGWEDNFWRWGYSLDNPFAGGRWQTPLRKGPSIWQIQDGEWNSWALTVVVKGNPGAYPEVYAANPVIATPPGGHADFDGDGVVTGNDFLTWQRGLGRVAPLPMDGDANGDGLVTAADLVVWRTQFGGVAPPGLLAATTTAAPEPSSSVLAAIIAVPLARRARRHFAAWPRDRLR